MKIADILRMPAGFVFYKEMGQHDMQKLNNWVQASCCRMEAKVTTKRIHGFDVHGNPVYLIRIEVLIPAKETRETETTIYQGRKFTLYDSAYKARKNNPNCKSKKVEGGYIAIKAK
jgi:hypothetical protein